MDCQDVTIAPRFRLLIRCHDCHNIHTQNIDIPEPAPRSTDELLRSRIVNTLEFACSRCEGSHGTLIGITRPRLN